ncbi:DUF433 domain-containing protein [Streptosporangium sp. NBC_01810]|uniref:DUF433 domain-containing protein n=1 Tax=Streptosporangium sp. NBC_01810 TaxID=2975951 RepID=UPI002DD7D35C|nr:DUF433 domain-containing protein [Streptosporangium sp. NBC_01810]WSA23656.1 DUF433 domain-containing protein [Streptosporangium sp. NBC_01810]
MADANAQLLAIPDKRAAKLAGISIARLRYWEKVGLVVPSIRSRVSARNTVRLYKFGDLIELLVAAQLRTDKEMTLQRIQKIVKKLRARGYAAPLRELPFAVVGDEIYFQHPDGTWEGDLQPYQIVMHRVLNLEPLRARIGKATERDSDCVGKIVKVRGVHASNPVIAGTRVRVSTVQAFLDAGYDVAGILEEYPSLTTADIEAVRQYAVAS